MCEEILKRANDKMCVEPSTFQSRAKMLATTKQQCCSEAPQAVVVDDVDYLWKLVAGSVGGGAVVKYGSILFPDIAKPNLAQALLMVSLSVLVAVAILIKESYSTSNEDLF
ncbi:hypothetical protein M5K25_006186 [Dendrobium thyrsiflorum]|uniref:Uncharacterized protein n=1 Tax=Dendrobium thyrsiflorum TaxID=117978 RepID=A0ABD0VC70_DENTH